MSVLHTQSFKMLPARIAGLIILGEQDWQGKQDLPSGQQK